MFSSLIEKLSTLRECIKDLKISYNQFTERQIYNFIVDSTNEDILIKQYAIGKDIYFLYENKIYENDFKNELFNISPLRSKYISIKTSQESFINLTESLLVDYLIKNCIYDVILESYNIMKEYYCSNTYKFSLFLFKGVYNIIKFIDSDCFYLFDSDQINNEVLYKSFKSTNVEKTIW
jgi:hypothetical protein